MRPSMMRPSAENTAASRLLWFTGIWAASAAATAVVAYALRWVLLG